MNFTGGSDAALRFVSHSMDYPDNWKIHSLLNSRNDEYKF